MRSHLGSSSLSGLGLSQHRPCAGRRRVPRRHLAALRHSVLRWRGQQPQARPTPTPRRRPTTLRPTHTLHSQCPPRTCESPTAGTGSVAIGPATSALRARKWLKDTSGARCTGSASKCPGAGRLRCGSATQHAPRAFRSSRFVVQFPQQLQGQPFIPQQIEQLQLRVEQLQLRVEQLEQEIATMRRTTAWQ